MELSFLHDLYATPGPWASVYFDVSRNTETSRKAVEIRWRDLYDSLHDQGLDDSTLRALDNEVLEPGTARALRGARVEESPRSGPHGLALFAAQGSVRFASHTTSPPIRDSAELGPLPHPTPLLIQRDEQIPWVRVIATRAGTDIQKAEGVTGVRDASRSTVRAVGSRHDLRKPRGGNTLGSQEPFFPKAENNWQHNAKEMARQVDQLAAQAGAEVIIVTGDIQARQFLIAELPERWQGRVLTVENHVDEVTAFALADLVAQRKADIIDRLRTNRSESAAYGLRATNAAFERRQVGTLLLDPDSLGQPRVEDELIRAAASTDAELILVSSDDVRLDDGVAAILRYVDPATVR
jgi:Bacterial archaeo-eukaryotic release factor family 2